MPSGAGTVRQNGFALNLRGQSAALSIYTLPLQHEEPITGCTYDERREVCARVWQSLLDAGVRLETSEAAVDNAWRSLMIGNYLLTRGDAVNYSALNQYDRQFEAECGDVVRAIAMFGQTNDARRAIVPLLSYMQEHLDFHNAGFKLQMLAHYYALTRDADFVRAQRGHWEAANWATS